MLGMSGPVSCILDASLSSGLVLLGRKGRLPALKGTCTGNKLAFVRFLLRYFGFSKVGL